MSRTVGSDPTAADQSPRVVETHTATLFFAGDKVYKLKKPVRFPFLDFSTREKRGEACRREAALNGRLAPDVYLGVATILGPDGSPCDHLVVMRRMPDDRRLTRLLGTDEAAARVAEVARTIAAFHASAATSAEIAGAGSRDAIARNWDDNVGEMRGFVGRYLDAAPFARVEELAGRFLAGRGPLFERRIARGMVRDGHGDLLADDIFCLPDGPRILDCIEFSDRLRYGDVLADTAFLAMDLERLGRPDLAAALLTRYREFSGDDAPDGLAHLYIAYRAQVRSKVACLRAEQGETDAGADARGLLNLAVRHLERARVRLVLIGGLPGTGKTTLTHMLADDRGWVHLHSDETRKELAGVPVDAAAAAFGEGIYAPDVTGATYRAMIERARTALSLGESVVLDASWIDGSLRDEAAAAARAARADLIEARCTAPMDVAAARIAQRGHRDASDATPEIALLMSRRAHTWPSAATVATATPPLTALRLLRQIVENERRPAADRAAARGGV